MFHRSRQIHLDYHCSEHLPNIADDFCREAFQASLLRAKVNSINLFAKCHHSWCYYPTLVGHRHPQLKFDLLGQQLEACKAVGIRTTIYFAVGWSANDAEAHPDWCARNADGSFLMNGLDERSGDRLHPEGMQPLPHFYWKFLCLNTPYHQLICEQVAELCENYSVDGFWFDIYQVQRLCHCDACMKSLLQQGYDTRNGDSIHEAFHADVMHAHCAELKRIIQTRLPEATVFFNGTTAMSGGANFRHQMYTHNTIQDLEDLPTTWGGYDKLPLQSKFFLRAGYPITAMSGKFHTDWGEFGGFKHPDAMKYEAASMVACGARCNFGDQLHPNGQLDTSTYEAIGTAFEYVEQIEAYGIGGQPVSRLGLWRSFDEACDEGVSKLLLEEQVDFDIANFSEDFSEYSTLILPSRASLLEEDVLKVEAFVRKGGSLIAMGQSLLNFSDEAQDSLFGVAYKGPSTCDCDYTQVRQLLYPIFVESPFLNYSPALQVEPLLGTEILGDRFEPYFPRTTQRYCSHQKTPFAKKVSQYPSIVRQQNCVYVAHELDVMYQEYGARIHREVFHRVLPLVYTDALIQVDLPSAGRISLLHQAAQSRYVLHLLYCPVTQRGRVAVLEDFPPLHDVRVQFDFPESIESVTMLSDDLNLTLPQKSSSGSLSVPQLRGHGLLVFQYVS